MCASLQGVLTYGEQVQCCNFGVLCLSMPFFSLGDLFFGVHPPLAQYLLVLINLFQLFLWIHSHYMFILALNRSSPFFFGLNSNCLRLSMTKKFIVQNFGFNFTFNNFSLVNFCFKNFEMPYVQLPHLQSWHTSQCHEWYLMSLQLFQNAFVL